MTTTGKRLISDEQICLGVVVSLSSQCCDASFRYCVNVMCRTATEGGRVCGLKISPCHFKNKSKQSGERKSVGKKIDRRISRFISFSDTISNDIRIRISGTTDQRNISFSRHCGHSPKPDRSRIMTRTSCQPAEEEHRLVPTNPLNRQTISLRRRGMDRCRCTRFTAAAAA